MIFNIQARDSPSCRLLRYLLLSALFHAVLFFTLAGHLRHSGSNDRHPEGLTVTIRPESQSPLTGGNFSPAVTSDVRQDSSSASVPKVPLAPPAQPNPTKDTGYLNATAVTIADELAPGYPLPLLAKGIRGFVTAEIRVDEHAQLELVAILDSSPAGMFDQSVIDEIGATPRLKAGLVPAGVYRVRFVFDPLGTK